MKFNEETDEVEKEQELEMPDIEDGDELTLKVDGPNVWYVLNGKPINKEAVFGDPALLKNDIFPTVIFDSSD